jgi:hypothetical protein
MLTQTEAETLIRMKKTFINPATIKIPSGTDQTHELVGEDKRELFLLDVWRGTIRLSKLKLQTRGRKIIVLVRLDIDGAPHDNPDGTKIRGNHIHLYREGFEDKWAYPINTAEFTDPTNILGTFRDFCRFCNITDGPPLQERLI